MAKVAKTLESAYYGICSIFQQMWLFDLVSAIEDLALELVLQTDRTLACEV